MTAETLPCGCVLDTIGDAFVMQPHALDCQYYLYFLQQAKATNKQIQVIEDPGADPTTGLRARIDAAVVNRNPLARMETKCPRCGSRLDGFTPVDPLVGDGRPGEGDLSVCGGCGGIGVYTAAGQIRLPTKQEQTTALADPEVRRAMRAHARWPNLPGRN